MKPALLDVNVLIALIDPQHQFHTGAHAWFERNRRHGWATCPITENGCLRILGKPSYPFTGETIDTVREILSELTSLEGHRFWPDSLSILEPGRVVFCLVKPNHQNDVYFLCLARS
jgi:predicted nucleic acid-binding protein